jgi:uncharacterized RDD family membrane protein YckC
MALLTCPDCGHRVSNTAATCPGCGRPSSAGFDYPPTVRGVSESDPWRRLFARLIDHSFAALAFAVVALIGDPDSLTQDGVELSLFWAGMVLWIPVEALFLATRGQTPGKALLGLTARRQTGVLLSFGKALNRSFRVWLFGLGAGLPLLSLIAGAVAYRRLTSTGLTSWDQKLHAAVEALPMTRRHAIGSIAALLLSAVLGASVIAAAEEAGGTQMYGTIAAELETASAIGDANRRPATQLTAQGDWLGYDRIRVYRVRLEEETETGRLHGRASYPTPDGLVRNPVTGVRNDRSITFSIHESPVYWTFRGDFSHPDTLVGDWYIGQTREIPAVFVKQ